MTRQALLMFYVAVAALLCGGCASAHAVDLTPGTVAAAHQQYNDRVITVQGSASDVRTRVSHRGHEYTTFKLCGAQACLHVFEWGHVALQRGAEVTETGRFRAVKHMGPYTFYNELDVGSR